MRFVNKYYKHTLLISYTNSINSIILNSLLNNF